MGSKLEELKKFKTPAPNVYDSEKGEDYLHQGPKLTMGSKLEALKKFKTPAPNTYDSEKGEDYLHQAPKLTMGSKLEGLKKFKIHLLQTHMILRKERIIFIRLQN